MKKTFLAIESSCDETAAAVVAEGREILSNVVQSSAQLHERFGGVVPELASRVHVEAIVPVMDQALKEAGLKLEDLTGLGVCAGPGLLGSLIVGVSAAKALAFATGKILVPVHHLASHIAANYLAHPDLEPPFLALVVSGAHSHLVDVRDYTDFVILARTRDDAPGEAYDKISRELGLAYPGGPKLDQLARKGNASILDLPRPHFEDSLDFSFSGIKTASLNALNKAKQQAKTRLVRREDILADEDLAAAFQEAVVDSLLSHAAQALDQTSYDKLVLAGGVSANSGLREQSVALCQQRGIQLYLPPLQLCTDNAAMTAAQAFYAYEAGERADLDLNATAMWELGSPMPR
ncbi:MAG: tRNA (adenosine(37)-N6)-threonylcarbamoyltransferase complex transferase subunit TsaD [Eubacteriales bacterium]|nr:tRNA (adenosine(37)-N6)-threonylcarbamoyltransferase complex transferase subunit TsaD [Eubacteriales bacterium]